jgi:hypothetical protein
VGVPDEIGELLVTGASLDKLGARAAGPEHATELGERAILGRHRAQHEAGDDGVDALVIGWQVVGDTGHDTHWHGSGGCRLGGLG